MLGGRELLGGVEVAGFRFAFGEGLERRSPGCRWASTGCRRRRSGSGRLCASWLSSSGVMGVAGSSGCWPAQAAATSTSRAVNRTSGLASAPDAGRMHRVPRVRILSGHGFLLLGVPTAVVRCAVAQGTTRRPGVLPRTLPGLCSSTTPAPSKSPGLPPSAPGRVARMTAIVLIASGFAMPWGISPVSTRITFSAWRIGHWPRNTGEKPAMCGVTMQLGSSQQRVIGVDRFPLGDVERGGLDLPFRRVRSASAAPSMIGPRAAFTSSAVGFISASVSALIRWRVSSVAEQWIVT